MSEDRQILSGIAKYYPNEQELVGKKKYKSLPISNHVKCDEKIYVNQGMILN